MKISAKASVTCLRLSKHLLGAFGTLSLVVTVVLLFLLIYQPRSILQFLIFGLAIIGSAGAAGALAVGLVWGPLWRKWWIWAGIAVVMVLFSISGDRALRDLVHGFLICFSSLALAKGTELLADGLERKETWAWRGGAILFAAYIIVPVIAFIAPFSYFQRDTAQWILIPIGVVGLWGLLERESAER